MPPNQHDTDENQQDEAARDAAEETAFASGFEGKNVDRAQPAPAKDEAADAESAAKTAPAEPAPKAPADAPKKDPFADLAPEVRDRLARVDKLEQDARSFGGRFAKLQKEFDALRAAQPAPPPPAPPAKRQLVRGELPEVADALDEQDELIKQLIDERLKPAAASESTPQDDATPREKPQAEKDLEEVHPDWVQKLGGTDFSLWLATQPADFQAKVKATQSATLISSVLTRFDADQARRTEAQKKAEATAASRKSRVDASATTPRGGARPSAQSTDDDEEEAAMVAAFKGG